MYQVRWSARARRQFLEILEYVGHENPANVELVSDRITKSIANLEVFTLGTEAPWGAYKLYIPKTSYFVIFRRDDSGNVGIRAFVHASRDWEQIDWENL
jgi:toxin ParE1/3/4